MGAEKEKTCETVVTNFTSFITHLSLVSAGNMHQPELAIYAGNGKAEYLISTAVTCFSWQRPIFLFHKWFVLQAVTLYRFPWLLYVGNESTKLYCSSWEVIAFSPGVSHTQSMSKHLEAVAQYVVMRFYSAAVQCTSERVVVAQMCPNGSWHWEFQQQWQ